MRANGLCSEVCTPSSVHTLPPLTSVLILLFSNKLNLEYICSNLSHCTFIFVEYWIKYDDMHDFSVWLRTSSNPVDINRFLSHTGNTFSIFRPFEAPPANRPTLAPAFRNRQETIFHQFWIKSLRPLNYFFKVTKLILISKIFYK